MRQTDRRQQFEAIFDRHGDFLKACLWKLTGDTDRFADAWQNVLTAVWQHLKKSVNKTPAHTSTASCSPPQAALGETDPAQPLPCPLS